jgi:hypothetical protein
MKKAVEIRSSAMIHIQNFIKIDTGIRKLIGAEGCTDIANMVIS